MIKVGTIFKVKTSNNVYEVTSMQYYGSVDCIRVWSEDGDIGVSKLFALAWINGPEIEIIGE